jgi:phage terminase large subunit-like protein
LHGFALANPGVRLGLVGETMNDARAVMVEGQSGLLNIAAPWERPQFFPSKREIIWKNGSMATLYSAEDPEQLRGPEHHAVWADEVGKWRQMAALDNLLMGLRLGDNPPLVVTTTPRSTPLMKRLLNMDGVVTTRGCTTDNADNLSANFLMNMERQYAGTLLGRQELEGQLLEDVVGALWQPTYIRHRSPPPPLVKTVVALDPAVTANRTSDETGMVVAGLDADGLVYVLGDLSGRFTSDAWAKKAHHLYHKYQAAAVVAECNNGGDLVGQMLKMQLPPVNVQLVRASLGKRTRAEPVAALYEQGRVFHCAPMGILEEQLLSYDGTGASPDRLDALVWAVTYLCLEKQGGAPRIRVV